MVERGRGRLARELAESQHRMALAGEAAGIGMWSLDLARGSVWATSQARALLGFSEEEPLDAARLLGALRSEDRKAIPAAQATEATSDRDFDLESRVS